MPDQNARQSYEVLLTGPLERPEMFFFMGFKADDPSSNDRCAICQSIGFKADDHSSNDRCAICQEIYETPNEDGTIPDYAVHFPCGHDVGRACFEIWINEGPANLRCMFCDKSIVPAKYLRDYVQEIWKIVKETSPERLHDELCKEITRGPLSRAIEPLRRYMCEEVASPEYLKQYHEGLAPTFEWLLTASWDFLAAVQKCADMSTWTNSREINLKALKRRNYEVQHSYKCFQTEVKEAAMKVPGMREGGLYHEMDQLLHTAL